jgi:hypothetical protein
MNPTTNIAVRAARQAGSVIMRSFGRLDTLTVAEKQANDFVSEVDRNAEQAIIDTIRRAYPGHAILAEESGAQGKNEFEWVIDPLDGTTNYLHGFPQFAVSIALRYRGRLEGGVVYDPVRDEIFSAERGNGALLNDRRLRVTDRKDLKGALLGTGIPFRDQTHIDAYLGMLKDFTREAGTGKAPAPPPWAVLRGVDAQLRRLRHLVGIADAGELRDLAAPRLGVEALAVARLAHLQRGGDVDLDEGALLLDHLAHGAAGAVVGRDGRADGDAAVLGDLAGDEADAADVEVAVRLGEAQLAGQVLAHDVAVEQGHRAAARLHQLGVDDLGERRLAGAGQAGEEQGEALPAARRVDLAQFAHHLGVAEPVRDVVAEGQVLLQLGVGVFVAVQALLLDLRDGQEAVLARHVALGLDGDHLDVQFVLVPGEQFLGGIGGVEALAPSPWLAVAVAARRRRVGVLGPHDQVRAAIVLVHDGVPQGLARAGHAHGQRQQRQGGQVVGEVAADGLVAVHARVVVQVAGLGHAHGGVQQDVAADLLGRLQGDVALQAVHGLAGLEGHHLAPAHLGEQGAQFLGGVPQGLEFAVRLHCEGHNVYCLLRELGGSTLCRPAGGFPQAPDRRPATRRRRSPASVPTARASSTASGASWAAGSAKLTTVRAGPSARTTRLQGSSTPAFGSPASTRRASPGLQAPRIR